MNKSSLLIVIILVLVLALTEIALASDSNVLTNPFTTQININNQSSNTVVVDDKVYVPLRFVSESLGAKVDWDASNRIITIKNPPNDYSVLKTTLTGIVVGWLGGLLSIYCGNLIKSYHTRKTTLKLLHQQVINLIERPKIKMEDFKVGTTSYMPFIIPSLDKAIELLDPSKKSVLIHNLMVLRMTVEQFNRTAESMPILQSSTISLSNYEGYQRQLRGLMCTLQSLVLQVLVNNEIDLAKELGIEATCTIDKDNG